MPHIKTEPILSEYRYMNWASLTLCALITAKWVEARQLLINAHIS
jgi:hypothetical protein